MVDTLPEATSTPLTEKMRSVLSAYLCDLLTRWGVPQSPGEAVYWDNEASQAPIYASPPIEHDPPRDEGVLRFGLRWLEIAPEGATIEAFLAGLAAASGKSIIPQLPQTAVATAHTIRALETKSASEFETIERARGYIERWVIDRVRELIPRPRLTIGEPRP